jgi:dienelactone hydrolase
MPYRKARRRFPAPPSPDKKEGGSLVPDRALEGYESFDFRSGAWERKVFRRGMGPGVVVIHEIPGLHPRVIRFADRLADAGFRVYLPSLFGEPGRPVSLPYVMSSFASVICIRREFNVWATDRESPIVDWLRALSRHVHEDCGGKGVGVIGMCLTGNFALAMMTEPNVIAPVLSQPSLPLPIGERRRSLGVSRPQLACIKQRLAEEDLSILALRFRHDPLVPAERFGAMQEEFGPRFEAIELDPTSADPAAPKPPHSVLTVHLREDDPEGETRRAETRVISFFRERLRQS